MISKTFNGAKMGKNRFTNFSLKHLRQNKILETSLAGALFLAIGMIAASLALTMHFIKKEKLLLSLCHEMQELEKKAEMASKLNEKKKVYEASYGQANPAFLREEVEPLPFLKKEVSFLSAVEKLPGFTQFGPLKKRMKQLTSQENRLLFEEKLNKRRYGFVERHFQAKHPVHLDTDDLQRLLSRIEGIEIKGYPQPEKRPQLFVKRFDMRRYRAPHLNETYLVDLELLQRELTQ